MLVGGDGQLSGIIKHWLWADVLFESTVPTSFFKKIYDGLTGTNRSAARLTVWGAILRWSGKRKGGADTLRGEKKKTCSSQANAAKCVKMTDVFATAGPPSAPRDSGGDGGFGSGTHPEQEHLVEPGILNH